MPEVDQPAPALKGMLFSGKPFDLKEMRGKVVLVNFYSSYCKHCAYEIGNLETFYEQHREQGFEIIVVGVDRPEDRHRVERMVGLYGSGLMADISRKADSSAGSDPTASASPAWGVAQQYMVRLRHRLHRARLRCWNQ